jgi:superfamily I DNA/RNA helicase
MLKLIVLKKSPSDWSKVTDFLLSTSNADLDDNAKIEDNLGVFLNESRQAMENTKAWTVESVRGRLEVVTNFLGNDTIRKVYQQYEQGTYYDDLMNQLASELCNRLGVMNWKDAIFDFEGHESIPMMTLHKSKGLEFHTVVFIGLEDQALWGYSNNPDEETCGFFVAFSRAKKRVVLTASLSRPDHYGRCRNQTRDTIKPLYDLLSQSGVELEEMDIDQI